MKEAFTHTGYFPHGRVLEHRENEDFFRWPTFCGLCLFLSVSYVCEIIKNQSLLKSPQNLCHSSILFLPPNVPAMAKSKIVINQAH